MEPYNFQLIAHKLCPFVQRALIALAEKKAPYLRTDIELDQKPAWFATLSPLGKVPVLVVDKQATLFESAVICEYLDEVTPGSLQPTEPLEKAYHRAWIEFGSSILNQIASLYNAKSSANFYEIHAEIKSKWQYLELQITRGPFFSGEKFHLIDAVYGPIFRYFDVFERFSDLATFADLPKCQNWRKSLRQRSSVKQAVSFDYPELLIEFLTARNSYISRLIEQQTMNA